jgi:leucyl aminopeptidase
MTKQLIEAVVKVQKADVLTISADVLAAGVYQDNPLSGLVKTLDKKLGGSIAALIKLGDFEGKAGTSRLLYTDGKLKAARLLLVGLGKSKELKADGLRKAAALAATQTVELKADTLAMALHCDMSAIKPEQAGQALTEGAYFGAFRYDEYITDKDSKRPARLNVTILDNNAAAVNALKKGQAVGVITGGAQNYARAFCNRPANVINPVTLAAEAQKVCRSVKGLSCKILDEKTMAAKKMGGILSVGQGSITPPRLIVLQYKPAGARGKPIALVGKAITFDSGGISIKPSEGMQDMKFDKSGGIAVLGAMRAIAQLKPKTTVFGLIPAAENMPSGKSYRPGDIVTTYSGKTVEIHSTDAEGRMVLCDAITYAEKDLGCGQIVDAATLTGACVVALGQKRAGLMGNNDKLIEQLKQASEQTGERLWHLPSDDEFVEAMKSKIADLKNSGGRWGGACTAGAFLSQFAGKAAWAHLDIAGVSIWGAGETDAPGSIGFGVRLLTEYVMSL